MWIFGFCYFGDRVTSALGDIQEAVYLCDWYSFPLGVQNYVPSILLIAQQPVYMSGFAALRCTMQTFETVT